MPLYVIAILDQHAVLCEPELDILRWANREAAQSRAEAVSAVNPGIYCVCPDTDTSLCGFARARLALDHLHIAGINTAPHLRFAPAH